MASVILDTLIAYKFIKIISTPWTDTEAFKLGILDANGKILKKRGSLTSQAEKSAYPSIFYTLCWNIKKILDRVPLLNLKGKPGALIASIMLLRELCAKDLSDPTVIDDLVKEELLNIGITVEILAESATSPQSLTTGNYMVRGRTMSINADLLPIDECFGHPVYKADGMYFIFSEAKKQVEEDAPVNSVGGGGIAGTSAQSEPPGPKGGWAALQKMRRRNKTKKSVIFPPIS